MKSSHHGGFQFLLILDQWGISFHAVVVSGIGKNLLFESIQGHCVTIHMYTDFIEFLLNNIFQLRKFMKETILPIAITVTLAIKRLYWPFFLIIIL